MQEFAHLLIYTEMNPISREPYVSRVVWDGDYSQVLRINEALLFRRDTEKILNLLPFPLIEIDYVGEQTYCLSQKRPPSLRREKGC